MNSPETTPDLSKRFSAPRVAVLLTIVVILLLLIPLPKSGRALMAAIDSLHAPVFALLAVVVFRGLSQRLPSSRWLSALLVWGALVLLGGGMEIAQTSVGRGSSLHDAVANALGAAAGLTWILSRTARNPLVRGACTAIACLVILTPMLPSLSILADALRQRWTMPRLASFEHPRELSRWSTTESDMRRAPTHATHGAWALQVDLEAGTYPGVQMNWMPGDWSDYRELLLDITLSDGPSLEVLVKIHDLEHWQHDRAGHDRFHQKVHLRPGQQTIRVSLADVRKAPRDRDMNLSQISFLQIFTIELQQPQTFYLDNVRLQ